MFGKRTSFGGNTPGVAEAPRPPVPAAPRAEPPPRQTAVDAGASRARTDEIVDVRSPEAIARDK